MVRRYDHIDLRVRSLTEARPFYDILLPALGFTKDISSGPWLEYQTGEGEAAADFFGIIESSQHVANENRIAFWAPTFAEVDRLAAVVRAAGGRNIEGPGYEAPYYYAVFFEDPSGNRLEVCHRTKTDPEGS
ncbi:MAG: VOC family protein [Prosthecobacter sp.]|nr:VOC family protein [Prosthecobacter sp.]